MEMLQLKWCYHKLQTRQRRDINITIYYRITVETVANTNLLFHMYMKKNHFLFFRTNMINCWDTHEKVTRNIIFVHCYSKLSKIRMHFNFVSMHSFYVLLDFLEIGYYWSYKQTKQWCQSTYDQNNDWIYRLVFCLNSDWLYHVSVGKTNDVFFRLTLFCMKEWRPIL